MATYISKQSGLWSSASTWLTAADAVNTPSGDAGQPPQSNGNDRIVIRGPHVVTYNLPSGVFGNGGSIGNPIASNLNDQTQFLNGGAIFLSGGGELQASRDVDTSITIKGALYVGANSFFNWGTPTDPLLRSSIIYLSGNTRNVDAVGNSAIIMPRSQTAYDLQAGNISMYGIEKTRNTFLDAAASSGSTTITVNSAVNWNVGDKLVLESDTLDTTRCLVTYIAAGYVTGSKNVPITVPLNFNRAYNTKISNFTSNIIVTTDASAAANTSWGGGVCCWVASPSTKTTISYVTFRNVACLAAYAYRAYRDLTFSHIAFDHSYSPNTNQIIGSLNSNRSLSFNDMCFWCDVDNAATPFGFSGGLSTFINRCYMYNAATPFSLGGTYNTTVKDSFLNYKGNSFGAIFLSYQNFFNIKFINCNFKNQSGNPAFYGSAREYGSLIYENCNFVLPLNTSKLSWTWAAQSGKMLYNNCSFPTGLTDTSYVIDGNEPSGENWIMDVFNPNNISIENRRINAQYTANSDNSIRKNGITSIRIKPRSANIPFNFQDSIKGVAGTALKIKGNLRFDSTYGTDVLPTISFNGLGIDQTFTCPNVANTWHSFEYDFIPNSTGDISISIKGRSSSTSGYIYLDGLTISPLTKDVRWYGYNVDTNVSKTIDTSIILTENQVSAYPIPYNLDYLYSEGTYWTYSNPTSSYYIDITNKIGNNLNIGSNDIVMDGTYSTNFEYLSSSKKLTLKTTTLSSGNRFDTIQTTGNIYLSGSSNLTYINVNGTVFINTAQNLQNTNITNVRYNSNTPTSITYKNCVVDNVQNSGAGLLTITLDNSTVNSSSGNVSLLVNPTILNITNLDGGYISIFDNNGTLQYYQNSNGSISLPNGSTGIWSYKIGKYNYKTIEGTFSVNPLNGVTINIEPSYVFDSFVNQTNASITSAYSVFNDLQQVYDYLSYFRTTSAGLSGIPSSDLYNYRNVLDVAQNNIVFDPLATNKFSYNYGTKTLTLSSQKMTAGTIVKGLETNGNVYLSGTHSLSGMYATIGGGIYVQTPHDLYDFNLLNSGVIRYNVNTTPISLVYTNSNINDVVNDGDATISITRINSIVNENDAEIVTVVPIRIDINVSSDTYWAVYRPNGTRYQYGNGTTSIILGGNAVTGTWSYRITRYGYISQSSTFSIDKDVSSTTTITPTLLVDTALTESNVAVVSAYTDLESTRKIYDYNSYYGTTSSGIDKNISMTKGIGSISLNGFAVELDKTATSIFDFQTSPSNKLIIKCSSLNETIDFYCAGDFIQSNGNTISKDVHIRANNLDSEIEFIGINKTTFYPTTADRDSDSNRGPVVTDLIYRFKLGNVYSGVTFAGDLYLRADVGGIILQTFTLKSTPGYNVLNLGTFGQIQQVLLSQQVINNGVKKASRLIPHSQNV